MHTANMVRVGARAAALSAALSAAGFEGARQGPPAPRLADLPEDLRSALLALYRDLGGQQERPALRPGAWDLALTVGVVVELDEELHFNRYRATTLAQPWAKELPWREAYVTMCEERERDCVAAGSWGKRWTTAPTERMFGFAAPAGELEARGGAPRWKQRALYDAVKDAVATLPGEPRVVRLAVHDQIGGVSLGDVLAGRGGGSSSALRSLVDQRRI